MKHLTDSQKTTLTQFIRFLLVGVLNTLITLIAIFICKSLLGINPWVSNAIGYVAGFVNSFLWNKLWVFHSSQQILREALKFLGGFLVCYALQLGATWLLVQHTPIGGLLIQFAEFTISGYGIATLIGMGVYTIANFCYNRMITFKTNQQ